MKSPQLENPPADPSDVERRAELRRFLRHHREKLPVPPEFARTNRRTPGLRREEIAERAGMSLAWYSWLEMGRPVHISAEMLARVALALELTQAETAYLYALVGKQPPHERSRMTATVEPVLRDMIDAHPYPACVLGPRLDLLATNAAFRKLFGQSEHAGGFEGNVLWRVFNVPEKRERHVDWRAQVDDLTALFRSNYADFVGNPEFESLISELHGSSEEFRALWERQRVLSRVSRSLTIFHPETGSFILDTMYFTAPSDEFLTVVFSVPRASKEAKRAILRFLKA